MRQFILSAMPNVRRASINVLRVTENGGSVPVGTMPGKQAYRAMPMPGKQPYRPMPGKFFGFAGDDEDRALYLAWVAGVKRWGGAVTVFNNRPAARFPIGIRPPAGFWNLTSNPGLSAAAPDAVSASKQYGYYYAPPEVIQAAKALPNVKPGEAPEATGVLDALNRLGAPPDFTKGLSDVLKKAGWVLGGVAALVLARELRR